MARSKPRARACVRRDQAAPRAAPRANRNSGECFVMSAGSRTIALGANAGSAETGIGKPETGNIHSALILRLKAIFPRKTWASLAILTGTTERTAKHRVSGSREFTVEELRALLRSEHGFEFLSVLMADADCGWWRLCRVMMKAVSARRDRSRIARELHEAVNADRDLSAAIGRAEAALAFQDEDFMRPHVDALGAMARISDRTVAPVGRRR